MSDWLCQRPYQRFLQNLFGEAVEVVFVIALIVSLVAFCCSYFRKVLVSKELEAALLMEIKMLDYYQHPTQATSEEMQERERVRLECEDTLKWTRSQRYKIFVSYDTPKPRKSSAILSFDPKKTRLVFLFLVPKRIRDASEGDIIETYNLIFEESGKKWADRFYAKEVSRLVFGMVWDKIKDGTIGVIITFFKSVSR